MKTVAKKGSILVKEQKSTAKKEKALELSDIQPPLKNPKEKAQNLFTKALQPPQYNNPKKSGCMIQTLHTHSELEASM